MTFVFFLLLSMSMLNNPMGKAFSLTDIFHTQKKKAEITKYFKMSYEYYLSAYISM